MSQQYTVSVRAVGVLLCGAALMVACGAQAKGSTTSTKSASAPAKPAAVAKPGANGAATPGRPGGAAQAAGAAGVHPLTPQGLADAFRSSFGRAPAANGAQPGGARQGPAAVSRLFPSLHSAPPLHAPPGFHLPRPSLFSHPLPVRTAVINVLQRDHCAIGACGVIAAWTLGAALASTQDQEAFQARSTALLDDAAPTTDYWEAPDSHEKVTIQTKEAEEVDAPVAFQVDQQVKAPVEGTKILAATYVVSATRLHFRSAPDATVSNNIIGYFAKGENVEVIGRTPDGEWALVGDNGVVVGYAAFKQGTSDLLVTAEQAAEAKSKVRAHPRMLLAKASKASSKTSEKGVIRIADPSRVRTETVVATTQCRAIVATTGKSTESKNNCQTASGQWVAVA